MQTMHSVLKRGGLYWDRTVLPAAAYEKRYASIQQAVAAHGDQAWLLFGDVARYGAVTFATNFLPRVRSAMAFVPAEGPPVLFANCGKRDVPAAKTYTWVDDVVPFGRLPPELTKFLQAKSLDKARIGLAGFDLIPVTDWEAIANGLPAVTWTNRDPELWTMRAAKEDWERAAIARSAAIGEDALSVAREALKPGTTMRAAIAGIDRRARAAGAEDVRYMVATGPQTATSLRPVDDRTLARNDTVLIYVAVAAQRYWAETARSFVLGKVPPALTELHAKAVSRIEAMGQAARAGAAASAVAAAADGDTPYGHGNAIGLDAEELPLIASNSTAKLVNGATLALRSILHENNAGIAVAQTVAVTAHGATPINAIAAPVEIDV